MLEVLTCVLLAIFFTMFLARVLMEYVLASQSKTINFILELLYTFIGFPMLVLAGLFLPYSIFVFFFNYQNNLLVSSVILLTAAMEVIAIAYVIRKGLKSKNMSVWEYIRSIFSIESHIAARRNAKEEKQKIRQYYTTLEIAGEKAAEKVKEREVQYEEFDLEKKIEDLCTGPIEQVPCWNCQTLNSIANTHCEKCGKELKIKPKEEQRKPVAPRYQVAIIKEDPLAPITRYTLNITIASLLFAASGVVSLLSFYFSEENTITLLDYSEYLILALSLAPIGFSLHYLTQDYFEDHIIRASYYVDRIFFAFSFVVVLYMLSLGFPAFAPVAYIMIVIVRVLGFYALYKALGKMKRIKKINVGGWMYLVYAFYDIIISMFKWIAQFPLVEDSELLQFLQTYKEPVNAAITVIIAAKLIIDIWRIRGYVKKNQIEPKGFETSWIFRDKLEKGEIAIVNK